MIGSKRLLVQNAKTQNPNAPNQWFWRAQCFVRSMLQCKTLC